MRDVAKFSLRCVATTPHRPSVPGLIGPINALLCQILMHLNEPGEVFRIAVFLIGQKFHLLVLSLPGQALVDYSFGLGNDMYVLYINAMQEKEGPLMLYVYVLRYRYASKWYRTPVKIQKMLHIMKMKSSKPCVLTAGGLYQMNIENFGMVCNENNNQTITAYTEILITKRL